jgi:hypothetical protein
MIVSTVKNDIFKHDCFYSESQLKANATIPPALRGGTAQAYSYQTRLRKVRRRSPEPCEATLYLLRILSKGST